MRWDGALYVIDEEETEIPGSRRPVNGLTHEEVTAVHRSLLRMAGEGCMVMDELIKRPAARSG